MIKNCPITVRDVEVAESIFGPDVYSLKGKSTRPPRGRTKEKFRSTDLISFPKEIKEMENGVRLAMDVMYVQSIMFLVTTSIGIGLITMSYLLTRQKEGLILCAGFSTTLI